MAIWHGTAHWTAGTFAVSELDRKHYHHILDRFGKCHDGIYKPTDNIPPYKASGYAAHTAMFNAHNIGIAVVGMAGFSEVRKQSRYMMTRQSFEAMCAKYADYVIDPKYKLRVDNIKTHFERGLDDRNAGKKTGNVGKIDIVYLPWEENLGALEIGEYMRDKIRWYVTKK